MLSRRGDGENAASQPGEEVTPRHSSAERVFDLDGDFNELTSDLSGVFLAAGQAEV